MKDQRKSKKVLIEELDELRAQISQFQSPDLTPSHTSPDREHAEALYQLSNRLAGANETEEVLDLIVNEASRLLGISVAYIRLLQDGMLVNGAATESAATYMVEAGFSTPTIVGEDQPSMIARAMATKKLVAVEDLCEDEYAPPARRLVFQKYGFHGSIVVPLLANGRSLGVLALNDTRVRRFTDDEVSLLTAFADQAALALEKARLLGDAEREKRRSDALYQVSSRLAGAHETGAILDLIVNEATRILGATGAWIRLLEGDVMVPGAATESAANFLADAAELNPVLRVGEGQSSMGHVMATKKSLVLEEGMLVKPPIK